MIINGLMDEQVVCYSKPLSVVRSFEQDPSYSRFWVWDPLAWCLPPAHLPLLRFFTNSSSQARPVLPKAKRGLLGNPQNGLMPPVTSIFGRLNDSFGLNRELKFPEVQSRGIQNARDPRYGSFTTSSKSRECFSGLTAEDPYILALPTPCLGMTRTIESH